MKNGLKNKINIIIKSVIMFIMIALIGFQTNNNVLSAQNINLNKKVALNSFTILDISETTKQVNEEIVSQEESEVVQSEKNITTNEVNQESIQDEPIVNNEKVVISSYSGRMTGYVYNCPSCTGRLACDSSIDLSGGNINYNDPTYGSVRIVASSRNLACGSIVEIKSNNNEPIVAIVLDRGVSGTKLDLLTYSVEDAINNIGNMPITYNVLRNGY